MTYDEILKLSNDELNDKIEELLGNEVIKGYVFENKRIPCPDNRPGCLVLHWGLIPRKVRNFAGDIALAWGLLSVIPGARWGLHELDVGGWTAFAMKQSEPGWVSCGEGEGDTAPPAIARAFVIAMEEADEIITTDKGIANLSVIMDAASTFAKSGPAICKENK